MAKLILNDLEAEIPANWQDQGMVTLTLPSTDKAVKPNVILTKETLPQEVKLEEYFVKIKESITNRGIKDFKISDERKIQVAGVPAMHMICTWDVAQMRQMLGPDPSGKAPDIKEGQIVRQVQVTLLKDTTAVNLTASFPAQQFDLYYRPFLNFLKSLKFV